MDQKYLDEFIKTLKEQIDRQAVLLREVDGKKDMLIEKVTQALTESQVINKELKKEIGKLKLHTFWDIVFKCLGYILPLVAIIGLIIVIQTLKPSVLKLSKDGVEMSGATSTKQ